MVIYLVEWLQSQFGDFSGAGLIGFITFRAGVAVILSLIISMVFGGRIIRFLRRLQVGESIRDLGLEGQKEKEGTPTMGGIIIILAILVPFLLMAELDNTYAVVMILATTWMSIIGFADDYIKVFQKNKRGLEGRFKVMGQIGLGLIIAVTMLYSPQVVTRLETNEAEKMGLETNQQVSEDMFVVYAGEVVQKADYKTNLTNVPFLKGNRFDYAWLLPLAIDQAYKWVWLIFVPLVILVVTAVSNSANLTDGLDGLATGVSGIIGATLGILAYVSSNALAANYLNILHLPGTSELVIFSGCFTGACLGFLWYNAYPAKVFMGDTGSLTIGGIIAAMAIILRKELLLPVLCGVFMMESLSVIIQVSWFKYTKRKYGAGRRIFLMSPLHHHYQKKGVHESKIVVQFWIVGILLAIITLITLKIR